ncbi:hypothetical protein [Pelagibacterium xiamenense]|uniref:hypothetical protein n=1 Tax=Pelagibacterium xiamenense TaxID=2901140 RepID=UPI001E2E6A9D|nr:hypothetical protein [Pelagibacterium xiamenense]MCD7060342.1 hypothetical protein [Pelagibacterium xiamenense]
MTAPRFVSLAALAASLLFIVLTITQANGLTGPTEATVAQAFCVDAGGTGMCATEPANASLTR